MIQTYKLNETAAMIKISQKYLMEIQALSKLVRRLIKVNWMIWCATFAFQENQRHCWLLTFEGKILGERDTNNFLSEKRPRTQEIFPLWWIICCLIICCLRVKSMRLQVGGFVLTLPDEVWNVFSYTMETSMHRCH